MKINNLANANFWIFAIINEQCPLSIKNRAMRASLLRPVPVFPQGVDARIARLHVLFDVEQGLQHVGVLL